MFEPIDYGSVCSGIEAATAAWHPLGMEAAWFAEIEPFPSAVLAHHYPNVQNLGDMTKLAALVLSGKIKAPAVLVGGTPCQAFSVAGMREGLADPRGALTIKYVELADAIDHVRARRGEPEVVTVWENVPGVLSDKQNAFGCFLGALAGEDCEVQPSGKRWTDAGCVYGPKRTVAWRILDAQYFGLAQRRRRVFVVSSARRGFDPLEVLFEREGVRRDTAPRRGEGQDVTGTAPFGPALQCGCGHVFPEELGHYGCMNCEGDEGPAVTMFGGIPAFGGHSLGGSIERSATLTAKDSRLDIESETFCVHVAPTIRAGGNSTGGDRPPGTDVDTADSLIVVHGTQDPCVLRGMAHTLGRNTGQENALLAVADPGFETCATLDARTKGGGFPGTDGACGGHVVAAFAENSRAEVRLEGGDGSIAGSLSGGGGKAGQGMPCVAYSIQAGALRTNPTSGPDGVGVQADHAYTLEARAEVQAVQSGSAVRRLTPKECERLQGFPDDYTLIPWRSKPAVECPDGPRYKAIGNSKAVPVVRWIGRRLLNHI